MAPKGLREHWLKQKPQYRTSFGFVTDMTAGKGVYFVFLELSQDKNLIGRGYYRQQEDHLVCGELIDTWKVSSEDILALLEGIVFEDYPPYQWILEGVILPGTISPLEAEQLNHRHRDIFLYHTGPVYFWSSTWSIEFYQRQAALGYIAVAGEFPQGTFLLPELQEAYAVLDWENLHISRKLRPFLAPGFMEQEGMRLVIEEDPRLVISHLDRFWGDKSWLLTPYQDLLCEIHQHRKGEDPFQLWGVRLEVKGETVAGELGYSIGSTYTSLTGFFYRQRKEWNHLGKLQMVLLAQLLEGRGASFWNLGHPYMDYKLQLGAAVVPRSEFLSRWDQAVLEPPLSLGTL